MARLEARGNDPTFAGYREEYLRRMGLTPSSAVLDLGCGTGVVARAIAAQEGFSGPPIVALDQSPVMISAARRLATDESVSSRIDFRIGDAHALALPDSTFDAVIAHTLVSHVRDPLDVITEAARVVRPGGAVTIFDGDYASWTGSRPGSPSSVPLPTRGCSSPRATSTPTWRAARSEPVRRWRSP